MRNPATAIGIVTVLALAIGAARCGGNSGQGGETAVEPAGATPGGAGAADPGQPAAPAGGGACADDGDCVPAECCHPRTCVHKDGAPDCRDMMCTMDCRGGTMDCGGGRCLCLDGKCTAEIHPPKKPKILSDPPPPPMPQ